MSIFERKSAIVRTNKTLKEYREKYGRLFDKGRIIAYTKKEYDYYFNEPHFRPNYHYRSIKIKEYWLIGGLYYEVPQSIFHAIIGAFKSKPKSTPSKHEEVAKVTTKKRTKDRAISYDMMHYKGNRSSFWLILLAIALNIAMFIIIYRANTSKLAADLQLGFDLIINVVFMLVAFLAAEKTKRYSKEWGIVSFVLGGIQVARIFWIPLYYYLNGGISSGEFSACVILQACGAAACIFAGALTLIKYRILQDHEPLIKKQGAKKDVRT